MRKGKKRNELEEEKRNYTCQTKKRKERRMKRYTEMDGGKIKPYTSNLEAAHLHPVHDVPLLRLTQGNIRHGLALSGLQGVLPRLLLPPLPLPRPHVPTPAKQQQTFGVLVLVLAPASPSLAYPVTALDHPSPW